MANIDDAILFLKKFGKELDVLIEEKVTALANLEHDITKDTHVKQDQTLYSTADTERVLMLLPKENLLYVLFESLGLMRQYNGRTRYWCVEEVLFGKERRDAVGNEYRECLPLSKILARTAP